MFLLGSVGSLALCSVTISPFRTEPWCPVPATFLMVALDELTATLLDQWQPVRALHTKRSATTRRPLRARTGG